MTELRLAGLDLTDVSSRLLVRFVPHLTRLDLSQCGGITDQTVHTLTSPISPLRETLVYLNLAGKRRRGSRAPSRQGFATPCCPIIPVCVFQVV